MERRLPRYNPRLTFQRFRFGDLEGAQGDAALSPDKDAYESWADEYDSQSLKCQWHGPAVLFGMMYPHLKPGQSLLDLGIGTGLGTLPFHNAGLKVAGMDRSPAMIKRCRRRGLSWEIIEHDLAQVPWPIEDRSIDHIVSAGVTHFIGDLQGVISEASRVIRNGGLFGFDYYEIAEEAGGGYSRIGDGIYELHDDEYDVQLYRHTEQYVFGLLSEVGFRVVYETEFLVSRERKKFFRAVVSRL
jgi:predicted TPR repeat methyltransferase